MFTLALFPAAISLAEAMFVVPLVMLAVFEVWMLINMLRNPKLRGSVKILWVLGILVFQPFGAVAYFFTARKQ